MKEYLDSNSGKSSLRLLTFIMAIPVILILLAITYKIVISAEPDYSGMATLAGAAISAYGVILASKAFQKKYEQ